MAKFYGKVGYGIPTETKPGVYTTTITEYPYYGDVMRNIQNIRSGNQVNDNLTSNTQISIVADPFANQNYYRIKYVVHMGVKWKVISAEPLSPRILLTLGEVYNGK